MYIIEVPAIAEADNEVSFLMPASACPALLAASEGGEVLVVESPDAQIIAGHTVVHVEPLEPSDDRHTIDTLVQVTLHEDLHVSRRHRPTATPAR